MAKEILRNDFIYDFRALEVYKLAYSLSREVHKHSLTFPKIEQYGLADQMRRASRSVCTSLAEGYAKQNYSKMEFLRLISVAVGSCSEMLVWLDYCVDFDYVDEDTYGVWSSEYDKILRMLGRLRTVVMGKAS